MGPTGKEMENSDNEMENSQNILAKFSSNTLIWKMRFKISIKKEEEKDSLYFHTIDDYFVLLLCQDGAQPSNMIIQICELFAYCSSVLYTACLSKSKCKYFFFVLLLTRSNQFHTNSNDFHECLNSKEANTICFVFVAFPKLIIEIDAWIFIQAHNNASAWIDMGRTKP